MTAARGRCCDCPRVVHEGRLQSSHLNLCPSPKLGCAYLDAAGHPLAMGLLGLAWGRTARSAGRGGRRRRYKEPPGAKVGPSSVSGIVPRENQFHSEAVWIFRSIYLMGTLV